ncbi:MAG: Ldh family oxidoreductase [Phycisphaerae bacterium]|nr:Ldh family oxidoreductase [Phycisphaerae bacterium]
MPLCVKPVRPDDLHAFCVEAMLKAGMDRADADITAEVLVATDTWGTYTHGTKQLRPLLQSYRDGRMDLHAKPELVGQGASWATFDGHHSMPMPASVLAMTAAIDKAHQTGIAVATVRNSGHYGAAGYYAHLAARQDMIGLSFTNVDPCMAVPGSRGPVLGTNPIAYAVPAGDEPPVMLDIATSVVAASKVFALRDVGKPIPDGWLVNADGLPTTDPTGYPAVGALLPMAAHKGYGLALMVEILTGVLSGGAFGNGISSWGGGPVAPVSQSHTFIAIHIAAFEPVADFKRRMDELTRQIRSAPKAKGSDRIYLPGEMEHESRQRAIEDGMALPDHVMLRLQGMAEDLGLDLIRIYGQHAAGGATRKERHG